MSDVDSLRAKLRELDEKKSELEDERNSQTMAGKKGAPYSENKVRDIDAQIGTLETRMSSLVLEIEAAK